MTQVCVTRRFDLSALISRLYAVDDHRNQPQPSQGESSLFDGSWPIFSIYSKKSDEEDQKLAERWQRDADSILVFVSPAVLYT